MTDTKPPDIDRPFSDPATYFRTTAIRYRSMESPFYEGRARLRAEDAELMALAAETPRGQPFNHIFEFFGRCDTWARRALWLA